MSPGRRRPDLDIVFVVWWYRLLLTSLFALFTALFGSFLVDGSNSVTTVLSSVSTVVTLGATIRSARAASIRLTDEGVVVRGIRVTTVPWADIAGARVGAGSTMFLSGWRVPCIELVDGDVVVADDFRSLRTPSVVDDVVEAIHEKLRVRAHAER